MCLSQLHSAAGVLRREHTDAAGRDIPHETERVHPPHLRFETQCPRPAGGALPNADRHWCCSRRRWRPCDSTSLKISGESTIMISTYGLTRSQSRALSEPQEDHDAGRIKESRRQHAAKSDVRHSRVRGAAVPSARSVAGTVAVVAQKRSALLHPPRFERVLRVV